MIRSLWVQLITTLPTLPVGFGRVKCANRFCACYLLPNSRKGKVFCNNECAWREQSAVYADKQKAKKLERNKL